MSDFREGTYSTIDAEEVMLKFNKAVDTVLREQACASASIFSFLSLQQPY